MGVCLPKFHEDICGYYTPVFTPSAQKCTLRVYSRSRSSLRAGGTFFRSIGFRELAEGISVSCVWLTNRLDVNRQLVGSAAITTSSSAIKSIRIIVSKSGFATETYYANQCSKIVTITGYNSTTGDPTTTSKLVWRINGLAEIRDIINNNSAIITMPLIHKSYNINNKPAGWAYNAGATYFPNSTTVIVNGDADHVSRFSGTLSGGSAYAPPGPGGIRTGPTHSLIFLAKGESKDSAGNNVVSGSRAADIGTGTKGYQPVTTKSGNTALVYSKPTWGFQTMKFSSSRTSSSPTGLSNEVNAPGFQEITIGTYISSSTATGLSPGNIKGSQTINYGNIVYGGNDTGITSGFINLDITINGTARSVTLNGTQMATFDSMIYEITNKLQFSFGSGSATATIVNGNIKITSDNFSSGNGTINITNGTVFALTNGYIGLLAPVNGSGEITYTVSITTDRGSTSVSIPGQNAQTMGALVNEITSDLGSRGYAQIVNGNIRVISRTPDGPTSTVSITSDNLFNDLLNYGSILTAVIGTSEIIYKLSITIDNSISKTISIAGNLAQNFSTLLTQMNTDLGGKALASLENNKLTIRGNDTRGTGSKIAIASGPSGPNPINLFTGLSAAYDSSKLGHTYKQTIKIDHRPSYCTAISGIQHEFKFEAVSEDISTLEDFVAKLKTATNDYVGPLKDYADVTIAGNVITITSKRLGGLSYIEVYAHGSLSDMMIEVFNLGTRVKGITPSTDPGYYIQIDTLLTWNGDDWVPMDSVTFPNCYDPANLPSGFTCS